jgi:hypothetical protein
VRRAWKIVLAVVALLLILLGVNTMLTNADTEPAKAEQPEATARLLRGLDREVARPSGR